MCNIWIVAENLPWLAVLAAGAKSLAADAVITAFINGDEAAAKEAFSFGANQAFALPMPENAMWESYAPVLAEKARVEKPRLILLSASKRCRDLAAQLGALLKAPCYSDANKLDLSAGAVSGEMLIYGGIGYTALTTGAATVLATLGAKAFEPARADQSRHGEAKVLMPAESRATVSGRAAGKAGSVNLDEAEKVVSVGRGVNAREDLAKVEELAAALGAEIACSRPIAEFFKWLPEERYVGISGQQIRPKLYLAVGISGQAQHYYGVRDAKIIVSINRDVEALFNQKADYFIVGEWQEVLPRIMQALAAI